MNTQVELVTTLLLVLLAYNRRSDINSTERRAMFHAVCKTILSLI